MATFVLTCPHCGGQNMGFTYQNEYVDPDPSIHYSTGSCNGCNQPIVAKLKNRKTSTWKSNEIRGDLLNTPDALRTLDVWPAPIKVSAPPAVPDKVGRNYVEAAEARRRGSWNAACATYRRTMELALKSFAPDVEAWKLEKRIDKLAAEHRITADMQAWAHELRLDGNEALHGDEDATKEMTDQMHHLTHFLLTYLYTLPQQISEVRGRRNGAEDASPPE